MNWALPCTLPILLFSAPVWAHALNPAVLEFQQQTDDTFAFRWAPPAPATADPVEGEAQARNAVPLFSAPCQTTLERDAASGQARGRIHCPKDVQVGGRIEGLNGLATEVLVVWMTPKSRRTDVLLSSPWSFHQPASASSAPAFLPFVGLGLHHIATGWDHILFVWGLFLVLGNLRATVLAATAFTGGHAITLATLAAGNWTLDARLVEMLIAASLVTLAIEILHRQQGREGWLCRFPWAVSALFGLLHGMGFADAFLAAPMARDSLLVSLFGFNLGVELGQLIGLMLAVGIFQLFRQGSSDPSRLEWVSAYGIGGMGVFWTVERFWGGLR